MHSKKSIDIFLLCFVIMSGVWYFYHGIFAVEHYDMNFNVAKKFPTPDNYSSLGGDFAYPWNGAKNFLDPEAGIHYGFKCYLPTEEFGQCGNFPPTALSAIAFSGFSEFPFYLSYHIYLIFLLVILAASIYILSRMQSFDARHIALLVSIIFFSMPFHYEFERGNWHSIIYFSVLVAFYSQVWSKDFIVAAFLLTFSMFLKIHPALFLVYFFIKGYFRTTFYAIIFSIMLFFMSGGIAEYKIYIQIMEYYINVMSSYDGWGIHSTNSMLGIFSFEPHPELKLVLANVICGFLIICSFIYIFLMNKKSNTVLLKIELSIIWILENITPVYASRYSLIFVPFLIITLVDALDHEVIKIKFNKYWKYFVWMIAILTSYLLMAPLARSGGDYNIIANILNRNVLDTIRQLWFTLILLFVILIYLHWCIAKNSPNVRSVNPFRAWYESDLSSVINGIKNIKKSFNLKEFAVLTNLIHTHDNKLFIIIRVCTSILLIYLIYYSVKGSVLP